MTRRPRDSVAHCHARPPLFERETALARHLSQKSRASRIKATFVNQPLMPVVTSYKYLVVEIYAENPMRHSAKNATLFAFFRSPQSSVIAHPTATVRETPGSLPSTTASSASRNSCAVTTVRGLPNPAYKSSILPPINPASRHARPPPPQSSPSRPLPSPIRAFADRSRPGRSTDTASDTPEPHPTDRSRTVYTR